MRVAEPSISAPTRFSTMGRCRSKSCMNQSVSRIRRSGDTVLLDNIHFRPGSRRRTRYSEGNSNGQRRVLTFRSQANCLVLNPQLEKLKCSKFNTPDDLAAFSQRFDEGVKKIFSTSNSRKDQYIRFGSLRDHDPKCGVTAGKFTLTG